MKKLALIGLIFVLIATLFAGCAKPALSAPVTIVDDLGREVYIEAPPERIVSLTPSNTEILFALNLGDKVVGVTIFCNYPEEAKEKPKIRGFTSVDIEKVVALRPDLILAAGIHKHGVIPALEKKGLTIFALEPKNLEAILEDIQMVGKITGREEEASELVNQMESRIKAITNQTKNIPEEERPRVFYILWAPSPLWTCGSNTFTHDLIGKAGGVNIFRNIMGYKVVDIEKVIAYNPEVIIACTGHGEAKDLPFEWAKGEPMLKSTEARKSERIYEIDADLVCRSGPRIVDALERFAHFIHPEIFPKP